MSRIGRRELPIPQGVTIETNAKLVTVTGPKGTLTLDIKPVITVSVEDNKVLVKRSNELKTTKQLHGTYNSLIKNMIEGVSTGYSKDLEITGVGYKFTMQGNKINVSAGYSHPILIDIPENLKVVAPSTTELSISGIDKQAVGEFAAVIRKVREPEPYKGKGIHYKNEHIRRKEGKKAA